MKNDNFTEQVYGYIWKCLKESQELPTLAQIGKEVGGSREDVQFSIRDLRQQGRIEPTTYCPTNYSDWWRENSQREQTWKGPSQKALRSYQRRTRNPTARPLSVSE